MAAGYKGGQGLRITKGKQTFEDIVKNLELLTNVEVLVGFPEDTTDRKDEESAGITNAALGYIHDNGAPEANIPARPFMEPGVLSEKEKLTDKLGQIARRVASDKSSPSVVEVGMTQVGLIAKLGIQKMIASGIDPPLADSTLRARARRGRGNKGALRELDRRWDGQAPSTLYAVPLVDTAEMLKAVNFVIRSRKRRT